MRPPWILYYSIRPSLRFPKEDKNEENFGPGQNFEWHGASAAMINYGQLSLAWPQAATWLSVRIKLENFIEWIYTTNFRKGKKSLAKRYFYYIRGNEMFFAGN